jgi:NAD+ synthase
LAGRPAVKASHLGAPPTTRPETRSLSDDLGILVAQINPTMGDIRGNLALLLGALETGRSQRADLVVCPEMCLLGYPPDDLVLKPALQQACRDAALELAAGTRNGPAILFGAPWREGEQVYNAALLAAGGEITAWRAKHELPNYGVFDDKRVFAVGPAPGPMPLGLTDGTLVRLGVMICEDMWFPDVAEGLQESGAEILICLNASPFEAAKQDIRIQHAVARVTETGLPLLSVYLMGGQDELVFDGSSFAINADRTLAAHLPSFIDGCWLTRWQRGATGGWRCISAPVTPPLPPLESIYQAMVLGLRDYVSKNRFPGVVLGLSGGIDSALSAAVAVDALGRDSVRAVMMPSRFTSRESLEDAAACAQMLGIRLDEVPIEPAFEALRGMLAHLFADLPADTTEENIQSRVRGIILMAISNKLGPMVLTTGNKSEMSVGYATLYGDMCGGFSVLKDVYKTTAFELSHWRNAQRPENALGPDGPVMPERVITKPPSAELRADQKDEDSLPPYPVLDRILTGLIEEDLSPRELALRGENPAIVRKVSNLLDIAEYKRRQAPPGVKITPKAFGRDRRYPITNSFRRVGLSDLEDGS